MPFAGYKDFADCVSKNRDKRDPQAYCAAIMHKVENMPDKEPERKKYLVRFRQGAVLTVSAYSKEGAKSAAMHEFYRIYHRRGGAPTRINES